MAPIRSRWVAGLALHDSTLRRAITSTMAFSSNTILPTVSTALREQGWCVVPDALDAPLCAALRQRAVALDNEQLQPAGVGRRTQKLHDRTIRSDRIVWLDAHDASEAGFLSTMDELRSYLNRTLMLGLFSFESHFSRYEVGDCYQQHVDAFRGESNRRLSIVLYLNTDWPEDGGGELILYDQNHQQLIRLAPHAGTLVVFLSDEFPHEVLPARQRRHAIAGWFRVNEGLLPP